MASIRKRCKRRVAWVKFNRVLKVVLDSYPGGSEATPTLRFKKRPWRRHRPLRHIHSVSELVSVGTWASLFPKATPTVKIIPDYVTTCAEDDPVRLLQGTQIREADWIIGIDPGVIEGDKAVACRIVKGRDPKDGVIRYQLTEFIDFGNKAVKLHGSAKSTT